MSQRIVVLTGGTGFLGRYVAAALAADGWRVRMLARRPAAQPPPAAAIELVQGDLRDPSILPPLLRGASAVVHAAGLVKARSRQEFMDVNRDATARLAAAIGRQAPAARLVLVSSQAARMPGLSDYAASKQAGEAATIDALPPASWSILRSCVIYGPWDREGIAMLRLARRRFVPVPRGCEPRIAMIHARDAAAAILCLCGEAAPGRIYEACDAETDGHGWRDIVRTVAALLDRTPRFVPVPDCVVGAAGRASDGWAALTRQPSLFGLGKAREILHRDWRPDRSRQLPPALWRPAIDLASGMRETVDWWRRTGSGGL